MHCTNLSSRINPLIYLEDQWGNDAEGNIEEADVGGREDILHEKPVGHSLVILTEVPEIVQGTPQELSWQVQKHRHFQLLEALLWQLSPTACSAAPASSLW